MTKKPKNNHWTYLNQGKIYQLLWRFFINFWSIAALIFLTYDFFSPQDFRNFTTSITIVYVGILGLYAGSKEFRRWQGSHSSSHAGEIYVAIWTIIIIILAVMGIVDKDRYEITHDLAAAYIAVITIFIITAESKYLHQKKPKR
ncbi:MAG: hypothetical protein WC480_04800 [Patescibacteria group bacterium]